MKRLIKNPLFLVAIAICAVMSFNKLRDLNEERGKREELVTFLSINAHGLVLNADCALEELGNVCEDSEEDYDVIGVSLAGVNLQLEQLLRNLEGAHFEDFYSTINFVHDEFWEKFSKYNEEGFDESDFAYVRELRDAFQEFRDSLQNEDGSLKSGATSETYILKRINILIDALNQLKS